MKRSITILKQPLWRQGVFLLISVLIIFNAGNCFPNDLTVFNNSYEDFCLLYENEEDVLREQLEQLRLKNEMLVIRIKADYEKQQTELKNKKYRKKMLVKTSKALSAVMTLEVPLQKGGK